MSAALDKVIELARRIVKDDPDIALSHLGAELCRATCGTGKYAVRYGAPTPPPPAEAAGGQEAEQAEAGEAAVMRVGERRLVNAYDQRGGDKWLPCTVVDHDDDAERQLVVFRPDDPAQRDVCVVVPAPHRVRELIE